MSQFRLRQWKRRLIDDEELTNLLEGLVVDEAGGVFGDIELTSLDLLAKLPVRQNTIALTHVVSR
jgi:hypothetical protein